MDIPWVIGLARELDRPCKHEWDWTGEIRDVSKMGFQYRYTKRCVKCGKTETQDTPPVLACG